MMRRCVQNIMDEKVFIERILETENLTDELVDEEANWLLNWGVGQVKGLIQDIEDVDVAGAKVNALMAVMRRVNRIVGQRDALSVADLTVELGTLVKVYTRAFGHSRRAGVVARTAAANRLLPMTSGQALQFLIEWLAPNESNKKP
jgi:hypothetical protein